MHIFIESSSSDFFYTEPKKKMNTKQSTLVIGQSGYLQMPTLDWKVSGAMLGEEEISSQGDADMGCDNVQGEYTASH